MSLRLFLLALVISAAATVLLDPHSVLGVSKDASLQDIKKNFNKLALKYHPDKNHQPDAEVKFAEIREAYELLTDPQKKREWELSLSQQGDGGRERQNWANDPEQSSKSTKLHLGMFKVLVEDILKIDFIVDIWAIRVYAMNCHECQQLAPVWEDFTESLRGYIKFGRVLFEHDPDLSNHLGVPEFAPWGSNKRSYIVLVRRGTVVYRQELRLGTTSSELQAITLKHLLRTEPAIIQSIADYHKFIDPGRNYKTKIVFVSNVRRKPHYSELLLAHYFHNVFDLAHIFAQDAAQDLQTRLSLSDETDLPLVLSVSAHPEVPPIILISGAQVTTDLKIMVHKLKAFAPHKDEDTGIVTPILIVFVTFILAFALARRMS